MTVPILNVENLRVEFAPRASFWGALAGKSPLSIRAVDDLDFSIARGEVYAIVGESGSGKTTTARAVMGLLRETRGKVVFNGQDVNGMSIRERNSRGLRMQMIFQDPFDAINPHEDILSIVSEPLTIHQKGLSRAALREKAIKALDAVGLTPAEDYLDRKPHELSGGQRQRLLIASALIVEPDLIIADEPVSMLDASLKVEILEILNELRSRLGIAILMITHDLALNRYVADRIAVMYLGQIVEEGPTEAILRDPIHPYTRALVAVTPTLDTIGRKRQALTGEIPDLLNRPQGCRFHTRCPFADEICRTDEPALDPAGDRRSVACHRKAEIPQFAAG